MAATTTPALRLSQAANRLWTTQAVRDRANRLYSLALGGQLDHFTVDLLRLDAVCDYVVKTIRAGYADLSVPPHARWRHFEAGEIDRWGMIVGARAWTESFALGRAAVDLAFISILLDGLAGPGWAYAEAATGETYSRAEGLAIASLVMFAGGTFSADPYDPLRVDARVLSGLTIEELRDGLQISSANRAVGLEERLQLIHRLGAAMTREAETYDSGNGIRPGGLIDTLSGAVAGGPVAAPQLVAWLMPVFASVIPGHFALGGQPLGDTWTHPRMIMGDETDGLVPFHQTVQWLTYSLIEPLVWAGFEVTDLDGLTALADVWNGSLLLDLGLIRLRQPQEAATPQPVDSPLVVEWRALTIALIDKVAEGVRRRLGRTAETFPLVCVMEGGTSIAGRRMARAKRPDGAPALLLAPNPNGL